jgi:hypothetical protein
MKRLVPTARSTHHVCPRLPRHAVDGSCPLFANVTVFTLLAHGLASCCRQTRLETDCNLLVLARLHGLSCGLHAAPRRVIANACQEQTWKWM